MEISSHICFLRLSPNLNRCCLCGSACFTLANCTRTSLSHVSFCSSLLLPSSTAFSSDSLTVSSRRRPVSSVQKSSTPTTFSSKPPSRIDAGGMSPLCQNPLASDSPPQTKVGVLKGRPPRAERSAPTTYLSECQREEDDRFGRRSTKNCVSMLCCKELSYLSSSNIVPFNIHEYLRRRIQTQQEPTNLESEEISKDEDSSTKGNSLTGEVLPEPELNSYSAVKCSATSELKISSRHDLAMIYTCKVCETRSMKTVCRESYEKGVVVVRCGGCNNLHLIADRLGWFGQPGSVEELLAARPGSSAPKTTSRVL